MTEPKRNDRAADPAARPAEPALEPRPGGKGARRKPAHKLEQAPGEIGGPEGPEPTRYGDWAYKGICSDF